MNMQWNNMWQFDWQKENEKQQVKKLANRCGVLLIILLGFMYGSSLIIGLVTGSGLLPEPIKRLQQDTVLWNSILTLVFNLLFYVVAVPILLRYANKRSGTQVSTYLQFPEIPAGAFWKWVLMGLGVVYTASLTGSIFYNAINNLLNMIGIPMQSSDVSVSPDLVSIMVFTLGVAVLAPFFEELLVRCGLVGTLRGGGVWFVAITTGVLFGFMHTSFEQVFFAAMMGIYAGFTAAKLRSIWPTIVLHMIVNGISTGQVILLSFLKIDPDTLAKQLLQGDFSTIQSFSRNELLVQFGLLMGIAVLSGLFLLLGILGISRLVKEIQAHPAAWKEEKSQSLLSLKEKCIAFFTAPGVVIFLCVSVFLSLFNAYSYLLGSLT